MLIVSAYQARSVTGTTLTVETFDNRNLNLTAVAEVVLAVLITQADFLRNVFGTVQLSASQWGLAVLPAIGLFAAWELGKAVARREVDAPSKAVSPAAA